MLFKQLDTGLGCLTRSIEKLYPTSFLAILDWEQAFHSFATTLHHSLLIYHSWLHLLRLH